jgi:hypothetical protein
VEKRISVTNDTKMGFYVGSNLVPPGETRDFPESMVPHHLRPTPPDLPLSGEEKGDPLGEMLKGNVGSVVALLPGMTAADIEKLGELEQAGQARKGVLSAIAEIQLSRAELMGHVASLSDEDLSAAIEDAETDPDPDTALLAALEAETARRDTEKAE